MFVEEGFRIRFANGEVIDFYAENAEQKEGWMKVLSQCVGKDIAGSRGWADMVLQKERREKARSQAAPHLAQAKAFRENMNANGQQRRPSSHDGVKGQSVPSSPVKSQHGHSRTKSHAPAPPPPIEKDTRHKASTSPRKREAPAGKMNRRDQVRSMIF